MCKVALFLVAVLCISTVAEAAPAITGVSTTLVHGSPVTITGSGFGTKSPAAPYIWDATDASSTSDLDTFWPTDTYPKTCSGTPGETPYTMAYRTSLGGFSTMPHSRITKFLCAAATTCDGSWDSDRVNNIVTSALTFNSNTLWATWYYRIAPTFNDTDEPPGDNLKEWNANSDNCANPGSAYCGLTAYVDWCNSHVPPGVNPANARMRGTGSSGCSIGQYCDTPNPMQGWIHAELDWTTAGYLFGYSNGSSVGVAGGRCTVAINQADGDAPVSITMGGWTRYPITGGATGNYRYWAGIYIDKTYSRVMLGNAVTWADCTKREPQIPTAWADGSITVTVNLGSFVGSDPQYLYVFDSTNTPSAGYLVDAGGSPVVSGCTISGGGKVQ